MRFVPVLLALAFLASAHVAAATGATAWASASVACLLLLLIWPLHRRIAMFAVAAILAGVVVAALHATGRSGLVLLFPPIVLTAAFGLYFARSLRTGRTPLIERIVRALHPEALGIPGVVVYARRVTLSWALLLLALAVVNAALALVAVPGGLLVAFGIDPPLPVSDAHWSLFANGINYALIGLAFVGEYAWRRRRFPQPTPYRSLPDFVLRVGRLGPAFWRES